MPLLNRASAKTFQHHHEHLHPLRTMLQFTHSVLRIYDASKMPSHDDCYTIVFLLAASLGAFAAVGAALASFFGNETAAEGGETVAK